MTGIVSQYYLCLRGPQLLDACWSSFSNMRRGCGRELLRSFVDPVFSKSLMQS